MHMLEVRQSIVFTAWLAKLRDRNAAARIVARLRRFELGNLGDVKPVGEGVSEARIDYGPGYRLYFVKRGAVLIVMLCGGDKRTQDADIKQAKKLAKEA
jgi:putative addiction module killer protein